MSTFYENHSSCLIVSLVRTEETPDHLLNSRAMPVIPGRNSWLMRLGWPWSSSRWQWVQVSPSSPRATDLRVRFAQGGGDPKLQSNQADRRTGSTFLHCRAGLYLGMGWAAAAVLPARVGRWCLEEMLRYHH